MKKDFDEEKAKIIVTIVPFVLIITILLVTLIVNSVKISGDKNENHDLQESIKEYADENRSELTNADFSEADSSNLISETSAPEATPEADATPTPYQEIMQKEEEDYDKVAFNKDEQLKEMMTYWEDNNQKALDDLAGLDRFRAMSWQLKGTKDFYYYGEKNGNGQPNGTGIAVYTDNQYYYGSWENGMRSGKGTWIHYHVQNSENKTDLYTYHQYTGFWKNDLPDGEGSEHYDFNIENLKENTRYSSNLIGTYKEGLINGDFYITTIDCNNNMQEWDATGSKGSWVYQSANADKKGNRTVFVDISNPDNYIWMQPSQNKNIGVPCLISKNKN